MKLTVARGLAAAGTFAVAVSMAPHASAAIGSNPGFGGYIVRAPTAGTARMRARVVSLPTPDCTDTPYGNTMIAVHLTAVSADASLWAAIDMLCLNTTPAYGASYSTGGAATFPSLAISPGDKIEFQVVASPGGESVSITDLTTGMKVGGSNGTDYGPSTWTASYGVINTHGSETYFPQFSPIAWSQVTFDGVPIGTRSPEASNLTRSDGSGVVLVHTTPLSPQGRFFKNTWVRAH
jgi:hypothetical protein